MDTLEIIINITISTLTGITTGFCAFKFLGKNGWKIGSRRI